METLPQGDVKNAPNSVTEFLTIGKGRGKKFIDGLKIYKVDSKGIVWNEVLVNLGESESILTFLNKDEACDKESSRHFRRIFIGKSAVKNNGHVIMKPCPKGKCVAKKDLLQPEGGLKPLKIKLECTNGHGTVHRPEMILQPGFLARDHEIQVDSEGRITGKFGQPSGIVYFSTIFRKNNLPGTWKEFKENGIITIEKCTEYDEKAPETLKEMKILADEGLMIQKIISEINASKINNETSDKENIPQEDDVIASLVKEQEPSFKKNLMVFNVDKKGNAFGDHVILNLDNSASIFTFLNEDRACETNSLHFGNIHVAKPKGETRCLANIILKPCFKTQCTETIKQATAGSVLRNLKVKLQCTTGTTVHNPEINFKPAFMARSNEIKMDDTNNRIISNSMDLRQPSGVVYYATIDRTNTMPGSWDEFMRAGKIKILECLEMERNEHVESVQKCSDEPQMTDKLNENVVGFSPVGFNQQLRKNKVYRVDPNGLRWHEVVLDLRKSDVVLTFLNKDAACLTEQCFHYKKIFVAKENRNQESLAHLIFKPCGKDCCFKKTRALQQGMGQNLNMKLKCSNGQICNEFGINLKPGFLAKAEDILVDPKGKVSGCGPQPSGYVYFATIPLANNLPGTWVGFEQTGNIQILECVPESGVDLIKPTEMENVFVTIGREMLTSKFSNLKIFKVDYLSDKWTDVLLGLNNSEVMLKFINLNESCEGNSEEVHFTRVFIGRPPPLVEGEYDPPNYNRNLGNLVFKLCQVHGPCADKAKALTENGSLLQIKMQFINEPQCTSHCSEFVFEPGFMGKENEVTSLDKIKEMVPGLGSGLTHPSGLVYFATIIRKDNLPGTWPGFMEHGKLKILSCVTVDPKVLGTFGDVGPTGLKIQGKPKIPEKEANIWNVWKDQDQTEKNKDDEELTILEVMNAHESDFIDEENQSLGELDDGNDDDGND